jgi:hypothetical protein
MLTQKYFCGIIPYNNYIYDKIIIIIYFMHNRSDRFTLFISQMVLKKKMLGL